MNLAINCEEGMEGNVMDNFSALVRLAKNPDDKEAKKVVYQNLSDDVIIPEPVFTENYQNTYAYGYVPPIQVFSNLPREMCPGEDMGEQDCDDQYDDGYDVAAGCDNLIRMLKEAQIAEENKIKEAQRSAEDAYLDELKRRRDTEDTENHGSDEPAEESVDVEETTPEGEHHVDEESEGVVSDGDDQHQEEETLAEEAESSNEQSAADDTDEPAGEEKETTGITVNGKPLLVGEEVTVDVG